VTHTRIEEIYIFRFDKVYFSEKSPIRYIIISKKTFATSPVFFFYLSKARDISSAYYDILQFTTYGNTAVYCTHA